MKITISTRIEGSRAVVDPDPLIAAAPALLGFVPERSIVVMCLDAHMRVTATMRHDVSFTRGGRTPVALRDLLGRLGALAASYGAHAAAAVFVDDRSDPADERFRRLARDLDRAFASIGGVAAAFAARELRAGAPWRTVWRSATSEMFLGEEIAETGVLSDPQASPAALHRAFETGRSVLRSRSEIAALLTPIGHCEDPVCVEETPPPVAGPIGPDDEQRLIVLYEAVLDCARGPVRLSCERLNAIAAALASVHVRDAVIGLCLTVHREAAERLWLELTRRLSGTPRAAAATLLGYLHYMEGSGAYASAAFDAAHAADPSYSLANLLDTALVNGMRPSELAGLADVSFDLARRLGVTLPPATGQIAG